MKRPSPSTCDEDQLLQLLSLVIHLYFAPFPIDIQLPSHFPIGPKQRAFTIHMTRGFITYEEDLDHSDAGVDLCPLLHNAFCRSNFVTENLSKHHLTFYLHLSKQYQ